MALSVITAPTGIDTTLAIGSPANFVVRFQSDKASIVGDTIQIRLAPFANASDPLPSAQNQTACYTGIMPGAPLSVNMQPLSGLDYTRRIQFIGLAYVDDQTFEISVHFIMTMDEKQIWDNSALASNQWHFEKNAEDNVNTDDNTGVSIYNQNRELWIEATDWDGVTAENAIFQQPLGSRWWCSGDADSCCEEFEDCFVAEPVSSWAYQLYNLSDEFVTGFSPFENTKIKFQAEFNAGTIPSFYYMGIYRKDDEQNISEYWNDLTFSYAQFNPTMSGISPAPFSTAAFEAGGQAMSNISGDLWEAEVEFRFEYFVAGATYRVFIVVRDSSSNQYSCLTADIIADGCPPVTLADTSVEAWQHDSAVTLYTEDYFVNVATRSRIKIEILFDGASYDTNLAINGLPGSFLTNLQGYGNLVTDSFPVNIPLSNSNEIPITFSLSGGNLLLITEFRIPENWSGLVKYIVFIAQFDVNVGGTIYTDQLHKVVKLKMRINDEVGLMNFTPTVTDLDLNDLELDKICSDELSEIIICFSEALPFDYDFIQIRRPGASGDYTENDEFVHTELDTELDPAIQSADADTAGGDGCMTVDLTALPIGDQQIGGVFISQGAGSPPTSCSNIDWESTLEYTASLRHEEQLEFIWDLAPLVDADVSVVELNFNANGLGWVQVLYFNMAQSDFPVGIFLPPGTPVCILEVDVYITLTNGCQYNASYTDVLHMLNTGDLNNTMLSLPPI